jgi:prevent-host-death family protein
MSTTIAAGVFKAKCLALLDEVSETGKEIVITKRGKEIAKVVPIGKKEPEVTWGRMKGTGKIKGNIFSTGAKWEAES